MMANCDTCGVFILPIHNSVWDRRVDNFWHKERMKLRKLELSKLKGFKKIMYKLFGFTKMPFYPDGAFCFCSQEHYDEWKKILIERMGKQKNDASGRKEE